MRLKTCIKNGITRHCFLLRGRHIGFGPPYSQCSLQSSGYEDSISHLQSRLVGPQGVLNKFHAPHHYALATWTFPIQSCVKYLRKIALQQLENCIAILTKLHCKMATFCSPEMVPGKLRCNFANIAVQHVRGCAATDGKFDCRKVARSCRFLAGFKPLSLGTCVPPEAPSQGEFRGLIGDRKLLSFVAWTCQRFPTDVRGQELCSHRSECRNIKFLVLTSLTRALRKTLCKKTSG